MTAASSSTIAAASSSDVSTEPKTKQSMYLHNKAVTISVDNSLLERAVQALLKHLASSKSKEKETLLEDNERILLQFGLAKTPIRAHAKPILIEIPHSNYKGEDNNTDESTSLEDAEICIIVKDKETKTWIKDMVTKFPSHLSCIKKIIGMESLRRKYGQYQQRRELLQRYPIFLADDRILPMVGACLGKSFFKLKKNPIPIRVTRKESFPFAVQKTITNTHLYIPSGTCVGLRVGHTGMSSKQIVENCVAAATKAVEHLPGKWTNILSIAVKSTQSVALPFYSKTPTELVQLFQYATLKPIVSMKRRREEEEEKKKLVNESTTTTRALKKQKVKSPLLAALKKTKQKQESDHTITVANQTVVPTSTQKKETIKSNAAIAASPETSEKNVLKKVLFAAVADTKVKSNIDVEKATTSAANTKVKSKTDVKKATTSAANTKVKSKIDVKKATSSAADTKVKSKIDVKKATASAADKKNVEKATTTSASKIVKKVRAKKG